MTRIVGYVRVSTTKQDADKQWNAVLNYANDELKSAIEKVEDTASGKIEWRKRGLGQIIEEAKEGDILVVSEISRLERSTLGVLEFLKVAAEKGIQVHIVKPLLVFRGQKDISSTVLATMLGMIAEIEREFISQRTKAALEKIKADGKQLGRPRGEAKKHKLDPHRNEIFSMLKGGISKMSVARYFGVQTATLYAFLERENRKAMEQEANIKRKPAQKDE